MSYWAEKAVYWVGRAHSYGIPKLTPIFTTQMAEIIDEWNIYPRYPRKLLIATVPPYAKADTWFDTWPRTLETENCQRQ